MSKASQLCPHCRGPAELGIHSQGQERPDRYYVKCEKDCQQIFGNGWATDTEAWANWERRVGLTSGPMKRIDELSQELSATQRRADNLFKKLDDERDDHILTQTKVAALEEELQIVRLQLELANLHNTNQKAGAW